MKDVAGVENASAFWKRLIGSEMDLCNGWFVRELKDRDAQIFREGIKSGIEAAAKVLEKRDAIDAIREIDSIFGPEDIRIDVENEMHQRAKSKFAREIRSLSPAEILRGMEGEGENER